MKPDFSGYATKAGLKCSDGRTIMPDAFAHQDKVTVPLVWSHGHDDPELVLGHAVLEKRGDDMYAYGYFNSTPKGVASKELVQHGDISWLSIYANQLVEKSKQVFHGAIREVSLVMAGANPGARIDNVAIAHSDGDVEQLADEAVIFTGLEIKHADPDEPSEDKKDDDGDKPDDSNDGKTLEDVYNDMSDEEKDVVHYMIGEALSSADKGGDSNDGDKPDELKQSDIDKTNNEDSLNHQEGKDMTRNLFEQNGSTGGREATATLSHDQLKTIVDEGKANGSFKDALLAHADEYGITNIELLFPEARLIDNKPEWITRRMEWVTTVLNGVRKLPYSRIKSMSADLTHEEARAKGYIKATMKKTQYFSLAGRETTPKTIYKKQQLDRDDIIDITELDVVAWIWGEMRFMLNEEIARAILIGDGREPDDPDKINEENIRPIAQDDPFYTDVVELPSEFDIAEDLVERVIRAREEYKGAGNPDAFLTRKVLNDMLLKRDKMGRRLYRNRSELAQELEVNSITDVPILEGAQRDEGEILLVLVNLSDYSVGTTKGGEISTFDDFDIDYNQYKYLIEGRMSGALTKHKTAQVFVRANGTLVTDGADADTLDGPDAPTFNNATGVVTIPNQTGVVYKNMDTGSTLTAGAQNALPVGGTLAVKAYPAEGYRFPHNVDTEFEFTRSA